MLVYIPDDLYSNKSNQDKVAKLFEKYFGTDILEPDADAEEQFLKELEKLGEDRICEYLRNTKW